MLPYEKRTNVIILRDVSFSTGVSNPLCHRVKRCSSFLEEERDREGVSESSSGNRITHGPGVVLNDQSRTSSRLSPPFSGKSARASSIRGGISALARERTSGGSVRERRTKWWEGKGKAR